MTEYEKSALIGHWRNGASIEMIALIMEISEAQVEKIISDYLKNVI